MPNYDLIPEHCRDGMKMYIEHGVIPGDFLQAVITNNLVEAFHRADDTNIAKLQDYAQFLYWEIPSNAWGSEENMIAWAGKRR